jgi:hypothetical protein
MSKPGHPRCGRRSSAPLHRPRQDPQLARIYYLQMTERGATHLKACCVVAGHLAERAWTVLNRGTPYVIYGNNGNPVTAEEAKKIIADKWTIPEDVRKRRRSRKLAGKAPQAPAAATGRAGEATLPALDPHDPAARPSTPSPHQPARLSASSARRPRRRLARACPEQHRKRSRKRRRDHLRYERP